MPEVVAVYATASDTSFGITSGVDPNSMTACWIIATDYLTTSYKTGGIGVSGGYSSGKPYTKISSDGKTITWYNGGTHANAQYNSSGITYYYFALS